MNGVVSWIVAWGLMLGILYALSQNKWGHTIIYYGAWLLVLFLIVTNGKQIGSLLTGIQSGGNTSGG